MRTHFMLLVLALAACGEDEPPPPPPKAPGGAPKAKAAGGKDGKTLVPKLKVEDRVSDAAEKATIRHQFRDKDFAVEPSNRDPFHATMGMKGLVPVDIREPKIVTKQCQRDLVAANYSYTDLRLVGIVAERAQRRVLMMDSGNLGHIIKKGDCVGREKALVKDIGAGFVTFQVQPEDTSTGQVRTVEEHSVQLYPNQMPVQSQPTPDDVPRSQAPVVAPPSSGAQPAPQPVPVESP